MSVPDPLDDVDRGILDCLRLNARESSASIGGHVGLTAGAVRKRIAALEKRGVIAGYTVVIGHDATAGVVEAFVELSFAGNADVHAILREAMARPEVRDAMTIAGETDALIRLRVPDLVQLRDLVMELRKSGPISGTRTLVVLGRWWHGDISSGSMAAAAGDLGASPPA